LEVLNWLRSACCLSDGPLHSLFDKGLYVIKTLPKAQRTRGLSSYHKFLRKFGSNLIFRMSTKRQIQNLNRTSASPQNFNSKTFTKPSFRISSKIQLQTSTKHIDQNSASILLKLQLKNLDQTPSLKIYLDTKTTASKSASNCCQHVSHHQH